MPAVFLARFASMLDRGLLAGKDNGDLRHDALVRHAKDALDAAPTGRREPFGIVHCARDGTGMRATFRAWWTTWSATSGWVDHRLPLPDHSALAFAYGTGAAAVETANLAWSSSLAGRTSRAVFSAFCDALRSGQDPRSGGGPQLVGLYRKGCGEMFGVIFHGTPYLLGMRASESMNLGIVEWRNELFERCDPSSLRRLPDAQPHARPRGIPSA